MSVETRMVEVTGRVLDAPILKYERGQVYIFNDVTRTCIVLKSSCSLFVTSWLQVVPKLGVWNMERERFHSGARIDEWAVVVFTRYLRDDTARSVGQSVSSDMEFR